MTQKPNTTSHVGDMDEESLLALIVPVLPQGAASVPSGDDAAVIPLSDPRIVVTTDVLVEDRHFRRAWSSGADIGWKAIMQNASDVVAMGAVPVAFVTALVLPRDVEVAWVVDLARGMGEACRAIEDATGHPCGLVGGDLSSGDSVVVAVTAHGDLEGRKPVLRSGAVVGDVVAHAGVLGHGAAGYAVLAAGLIHDGGADDGAYASVVGRHLRPVPALASGIVAASSGAHAMMDVSDGLLRDAGRLARASGVRISFVDVGVDSEVALAAGAVGVEAATWVLGGGEDHGMLAAFAPGAVPEGFRVIGSVVAGSGVQVDGRESPVPIGWDHFA